MSPAVEGAGVELSYREWGAGPAVLLIHGMADDAAGWEETAARLAADARVIAYDRRGYGGSGTPEPYERTTVAEQAEDAAAVLRALDAVPAAVCGRDLAALVCLDLVERRPELVRGAVLIDPALYPLVPEATEPLSEERLALEGAVRDGGPEAGVDAYLAARAADPGRAARARSAYRAFFADYGGLASLPVSRRALRAITLPMAVLTTPDAPAHVRAAADALAQLVPGARREEGDDPVPALLAA